MTESNKNLQIDEKHGLTDRQIKAIPYLVASHTITEGVKKAGIDRTVYYEWLKMPEFKAELDRQRNEIAQNALDTLTQSLTKAVENLVELMNNSDNRLRRLASKDIIEYFLQNKAIEDLAKRIEAIEQKLRQTN